MSDIRLTPSGRLVLEADSAESSPGSSALAEAFRKDWREGLFQLAARGDASTLSPSMRFWARVSAEYLTRLCHTPEPGPEIEFEPPAPGKLEAWIQAAPPMPGGEYLSPVLLRGIWAQMGAWAADAMRRDGTAETFLRKRAPRWNQVGRVTFHLAENKADRARPFAFMASFTTSMGAGGQARHLPLRKALELYSGAGDKPALLKLLTPVHAAAERVPWVKQMVESGEVYQPVAWPVPRAYEMLRSAGQLEDCGLAVRLPDWWKKRPRPRVKAVIGDTRQAGLGAEALLDFRVSVALGDERISQTELRQLLDSSDGLVLFKGQWIEVDRVRLQQALDHWRGLERRATDGNISFLEGMRLLAGAPSDLRDELLDGETRDWALATPGKAIRETLERLRDPARIGVAPEFPGVNAELRHYQRDGVAWLRFLVELGLGACLADDMGLGKTLQVLALLACLKTEAQPGPSLLVLPASLLGNWRTEAARFTPDLGLRFLHPSESSRREMEDISRNPEGMLAGCDLVVTTYSLLGRMPWLADFPWRLVILDEAQAIKNPATAQNRAARKLKAKARIALTGTPVENRLGDLWSLFDFLNPGLLGNASQFKRFAKRLEERGEDRFGPLRRLVRPYILRRLKTDRSIVDDLPDKTEAVRYCFLTKAQARLYQRVVARLAEALDAVDGVQRRGLVLQSLMRLKQICNHPAQFTGDADFRPDLSGKLSRLAEICEELAERQERVLVFTQFREIIPALEERLETVFGRAGLTLHGGTAVKSRKTIVDRFQREDGPPFFILSLKAGGTGLNLTAASHVIHFDRWWNPAVENQATDRAFRIGQKRNVLVHKFVTRGTIEERIDQLINEKKNLAEQLLSGAGEVKLTELPNDELLQLVRLDTALQT